MRGYSNSRTISKPLQMTVGDFLMKVSPALIFVAIALASNFAWAEDRSPLGVEWRCMQQYDENFHVLCIPEQSGAGSVAAEATGGIVKASLARGGNMRAVAGTDLTDAFFTTDHRVPLYAPPRDKRMIGELLQMVLCDKAPRCTVIYRGI